MIGRLVQAALWQREADARGSRRRWTPPVEWAAWTLKPRVDCGRWVQPLPTLDENTGLWPKTEDS